MTLVVGWYDARGLDVPLVVEFDEQVQLMATQLTFWLEQTAAGETPIRM
jgi:hypothetical protein